MTGLPGRALDRHVDLVRFYRSETGRRYSGAEIRESFGMDHDTGVGYDQMLGASLNIAETFAVTDDVYAVLDEAKRSLPRFRLHPEDLPAPHGYVHFESTKLLLDRRDQTLAVTGIGWSGVRMVRREAGQVQIGLVDPEADVRPDMVLLWAYTDPADPADHLHDEWIRMQDRRAGGARAEALLATHGLSLYSGQISLDRENEIPEGMLDQAMHPLLVSLFRFLGEPWIDGSPRRPERTAEKRARRAGRADTEVRVIALRARPQHADHGDPSGVGAGYSHRFLVRGHWRNQWYPSRGEHAPRWIPTYVKGPEDRPMLVKDRVFHVAR